MHPLVLQKTECNTQHIRTQRPHRVLIGYLEMTALNQLRLYIVYMYVYIIYNRVLFLSMSYIYIYKSAVHSYQKKYECCHLMLIRKHDGPWPVCLVPTCKDAAGLIEVGSPILEANGTKA
jgi:hypothetical protein